MDRLAAHVIATAVLTAALAAVPVAMANTISDASPAKGGAKAASASPTPSASASVSVPVSNTPSASPSASTSASQPKSAPAPVQPVPCSDAYQVGTTAYARWHGIVAFSVKEFYSPNCRAVYGYAYPWLQFRQLKARYDLGLAVFDVTHDAIVGARTFVGGAGGPDFWSAAVPTASGTCAEGLAHVFFPDTETDTYSSKFCPKP